MGKFIFDDLTGVPTVLASNRLHRVDQTGSVANQTPTTAPICPFCAGNEALTGETLYQDTDAWQVRVVKNKYPIVDDHEIIVHSPSHTEDIAEQSHAHNVALVRSYLNRTNYYTSKEMEVMIFNNRGGRAGASILHPHSQVIALKGFPGIVELEKSKALNHYNESNSCYWCDMVRDELANPDRVIYESKHFVLVVPKASRWSYEMVLLPKAHRPNFEYISEPEIADFAQILKAALLAYDKLFNKPDRNFWIHTQRFDPYHWHMGFIPHIKVLGGLELGAGIWVSDKAAPEDAAKQLAQYVKPAYDNVENVPLY